MKTLPLSRCVYVCVICALELIPVCEHQAGRILLGN